MSKVPSFRAGHPCGLPCSGSPQLSLHSGEAVLAPLARAAMPRVATLPDLIATEPAPAAGGYDPARFQRPPPQG